MKKQFRMAAAVLLALGLAAGTLTGCGSKEEAAPAETAPAETAAQTYTVGICQFIQHEALDKATEGFKDALTEKLGESVVFDEQNASGDAPVCATIANQFVAEQVDLMLANATPALQACANATTTIPILGTSVSDFGTALSIDMGANDATGINVSGTSDQVSFADQANQLLELFPEAQKVGILYCSAEANSKFQADHIKALLEEADKEVTYFTFTDSNDMQAVSTTAVENSEVIYVPTDNTVASNGSILNNVASEAKVPVIAGEEGVCLAVGGVATVSLRYYDIGYQAGEMAYEILVNGADPATMNIESPREATMEYIPEVAETYGIQIPENYVALEK